MLRFLKKSFITGLVLALPIGITIFFINVLLNYIGDPASKILFYWMDFKIRDIFWMKVIINTISIVLVSFLIIAIGFISQLFFGKFIIQLTEDVINRLPFIRSVYKTVKQVIQTFGNTGRAAFSKTVLVEYPRPGCYAIGFLASDTQGEVQDKTGQTVVNVFIPTAQIQQAVFY